MKGSTGHPSDAAWATATTVDVDLLDRAGLDDVLTAVRTARSRLDAVEVRAARRLRHLAGQGRSESAEHAISCGVGRTGRDAKGVTDRDEICEEQPALEDALDSGDLTGAHLDAIQRAAAKLPDDVRAEFLTHTDALLKRATKLSPDRFARECRDLARHLLAVSRHGRSDAEELEAQRAASKVTRWTDDASGMHNTLIELDPERDAKLKKAIDHALRTLRTKANQAGRRVPWQQQLVDATLHAITSNDKATIDRVPEIGIVADLATLQRLATASGLCETSNGTPLPVSTVRRLCCDAEIIPTVLDGQSAVVDHGRAKRTASPQQRQALRTLYATCAHPNCTIGVDNCRIHHVEHWLEHRGPTNLDNLIPLCEHHHHLVHESGWTLTMNHQRIATWTRPDGTTHHHGPSTNRQPDERPPPPPSDDP